MSAVATKAGYTPEDLLAMPDEKGYELVDGRLVERNMGSESSWVGGRLYRLLGDFVEAGNLGFVWPADNGFQCFPDAPSKVRRPDVSFVRRGRLPGDRLPSGWVRIPPDLVVEVISPNDLAVEVDQKVLDYMKAGVKLIWIVDPHVRVAFVIRTDGSGRWLTENDELSGEDVLPDFHCPLRAVLPPPEAAPK